MLNSALLISVAMLALATGAQAEDKNSLGAPPPLEVYGRLPAITDVDLSPSGTHVAMVLRKGDDQFVVDYDVATHNIALQPVGKLIVNSLGWIDDTYMYVTSRDALHSGETETVVRGVILDVRDHKSAPLSGKGRTQSPFLFDSPTIIDKNGHRVVYLLLHEDGENHFDLFSIEPATGTPTIVQSDVPVTSIIMKPDGTFFGGVQYKYLQKDWRLKFNVQGDWKIAYNETGRLDLPSVGLLGRDGNSVVVFINSGEREGGYYEVSPDGTFSPSLNPDHASSAAMYNPKTWRLAGFANFDDWVSYDITDPSMKALPGLAAKAFGEYRTRFESFAENPQKTIVYTEGADDAGSYYFIDFTTGDYAQVGLAYPDLSAEWITEKQVVTYKAADGLEIHGYLTLPPGRAAKNLPLIVMPHGGPEARDDLDFSYKAEALASRGYAVLQPNFRGSDGYGLDFVEKGYGEWGRKMQTDLSDGVRYLTAQGIVDPKRVCIWGASYGGYAALAGATFDSSVYRCAVAVSGISDLPAFFDWEAHESGGDETGTSLYWKRQLGDQTLWDDYSPARHVDQIKAPLLLIHGKDDTTVPIKQTQLMIEALKSAGKTYEYVELNGEDHYMSNSQNRLRMLTTVIDFIEKNNPAYTAPN